MFLLLIETVFVFSSSNKKPLVAVLGLKSRMTSDNGAIPTMGHRTLLVEVLMWGWFCREEGEGVMRM